MTMWRRPAAAAALAGLIVAAIGLLTALWQQRQNERSAAERFDAVALRAVDQLSRRMKAYEFGLRGARGTVIARGAQFIDRDRYQRYAESRDIEREFPGARGIGLVRRVPAADQAAFTAAARLDGWPDFAVRQIEPHDGERYVIQYVEPVEPNRPAVGLDIASEPNRRRAAEHAAETGEATLTGPITLVQATGQPQRSFLLLLPIYLPGSLPNTDEERRAAAYGWAYAPLVIDEVLRGFDFLDGEFTMTLADVSETAPQVFFGSAQEDAPVLQGLARRMALPVYGRAWEAELRATPLFIDRLDAPQPAWIAAGGLATALLAALLAYLWRLGVLRERVVHTERTRRAAMVDAADDAIVGLDLQGHITDWNPGAERLFGFGPAEALGRSITSLLLPEDRLAEDARIRAALARGETVRAFDSHRRTREGTTVEVSITASPVLGPDGQLLGFSQTLRDVSEARRAERELRELNAGLEAQVAERTASLEAAWRHLSNVLDAMPSAIGYWDTGERNRFANRVARDWYGFDLAGPKDRSLAAALGDRYAESLPYVHGALRGEPQTFERSMPRREGGLRQVLAHYVPDVVDGEVRGFYSLVHDITELKHAEQRLRASEAFLDRTGRLAQIGGWELDMETGAIEWTSETCRIHEVPPGHRPALDEAIGYYAPEAQDTIRQAVQACIDHGTGWDLTLPMRTAGGRAIWVRAMGEIERRPGGRAPRLFGAFQDVSKGHRLEAELRETRERFATAALEAGVGMWEWRMGSNTLVWDEGMYRINGVERRDGENLMQRWPSTMHPDDLAASRAALDAALAGKLPAVAEFRIVRPGGEVRHVRGSVRVARDPAGRPMVMTGVNVDITERKRAEEALREVNERFSIAARAAGIGVWEWDTQSNTLVWDDGMYRLYGRERAAAQEPFSLWAESVHPDDIEHCRAALQAAADGGPDYEVEFRIVRPDGEMRHVRSAAQPTRAGEGRARRMTGVNIDITARKTAELELRTTSALLGNVLDAASEVAIVAIRPDLVITVFNRGAERMLGYTSAEVVGRHTPDLFHDRDEMIALTEQRTRELGRPPRPGELMAGAEGRSRELTYIAKDGRRVPVALTVTPMLGGDGEPIGYMGLAHDVTRQKQAEASLRMAKARAELANQAKSQFLANMSHEIRSPMNAVINLVYLLAQSPLDAAQRSLLDKVEFANRALLGVINDILDLSKIEAGELAIESAPFALPSLLRDLGDVMALQAAGKGIAFEVELAEGLPPAVRSDAVRLQQILTNLLSNAIKFTEHGSVTLTVSRIGGAPEGSTMLRFAVRDTGPGIPPGVQSRLFAPFAQADASTTRRFGGTGLGLSIVKRLAQLMGGQVGLSSTLGEGSEFWVELPLEAADASELPAAPERVPRPGRALRGISVLVVDDSEINLEVAQRILALEGARVTLAENGREALACLRADPAAFDAVLMDVQMPVMDGYEATRHIRAEPALRGLPVIALTAGALTSERQRADAAGMDDFVTKPFDARALVACIRSHVGAKLGAAPSDSGPGELVPPAPQRVAGWPRIEGIDLSDVRTRLGDDLSLFASTLRRVITEFADLAEPPAAPPADAAALDQLRTRMHRLRGSAGLLGASEVAERARRVEQACEQGDAAEATRLGETLSAALGRLRRAVAAAEPLTPSPAAADGEPAPLDPAAVAELQCLLAQQSLAALDAFEALAPALVQRFGRDACEALRGRIEDLQFAQAVALLDPLAAQAQAADAVTDA